MNIQYFLPLGVVHRVDHTIPQHTRVVHEDVRAAEFIRRFLGETLAETVVGDRARYTYSFGAVLPHGCGGLLRYTRIEVVHYDGSALLREQFGYGQADAAAGACYHGDFVG